MNHDDIINEDEYAENARLKKIMERAYMLTKDKLNSSDVERISKNELDAMNKFILYYENL